MKIIKIIIILIWFTQPAWGTQLAHWPLNEGSGTTASDVTGNGNDGVLTNGPIWVANELMFDGIDDYVNVGTLVLSGESLSLTAWVKSDKLKNCRARDCRIISKATSTVPQNHYWMLSTIKVGTKTRLRFRLKTNGSTTTLIASSGNLKDGELFHAAAVYDGSSMILYKNGIEVGRRAKTGTIAIDNSLKVWIGSNPTVATSRPWKGTISDVRVYQMALTEQEINDIKDGDPIPLEISNVRLNTVTKTNATITWDSNTAADSDVSYGLTDTYESGTVSNASLVTTHSATITGLTPGTTIHYRVSSKDSRGNQVFSPDRTFRTVRTNSQAPLSQLIAHWLLDEGSGTRATDATGYGNHGALINGPIWNGDQLIFDGVDDYVSVDNLDVTGQALSLTAWVRSDKLNNCRARDCRIISKATGTATQSHHWMLSTIKTGSKTRLRFRLKTNDSTSTLIASSGNLKDGELFHVAAVYDGSNMILYKNGIEVGRRVKTGTINTDNSVRAWIGSNPTVSTSRPWKGSISDIRVYQIALSGMEIKDVIANEDDITAPKVLNIQRIVTETTATISWNTDEPAESKVEYGLDRNYGQTISAEALKTEHSLRLTNLKPSTQYRFRVISKDSSGNIGTFIRGFTFTTSKALIISNIQRSIGSIGVHIAWETNIPGSPGFGRIDYGLTNDYGQSKSENRLGSGFFHSVGIGELNPDTLYHYRISSDSLDSDNTVITTTDMTFITSKAVIPGPRISINDIHDYISVSATTVTINWTTDAPATSQINFGFDSNYGTTINNDALVTEHKITLTDLDPNTWYRYQISATDALGNTSTRDFLELFESDLRFITSSLNPSETKLACADIDDIRQIKFQDINGDHKTDLIALCNGFVLTRLGLGDGRFAADSQQFNVGHTPSNIQIVDVNKDNLSDLVISNLGDISVLLGLGDGNFETEKRYADVVSTHNLALKDINDDNLLDLIIPYSAPDDISILLGKANGTFGTQNRYPIGEGGKRRSLTVITDVNEDGYLDLAISFLGHYDTDNRVILLPGNGDGSFNSAEILFSGIDISIDSTTFSDINGDNHIDIIISSDSTFQVLLGNGDGSFDNPIIHNTQRESDDPFFGYVFLEIFDVNADNFPDIIGGGVIDDANGHFEVWLGKGDGTFTEKSSLTALRDVIASDIIIADLDKDGIQELIINDCCDQGAGDRLEAILIAKNQGDGTFELMERYDDQGTLFLFGGRLINTLAVTDVDADGYLDIVTLGLVLFNQQDGTFIGKRMTVE